MDLKTVVVVNDFGYVNGGASEVAIMSAVELSKKHRVIFFCAVGPIDEILKDSNVEVIWLNQKWIVKEPNIFKAMIQGIWNLKAKRKFQQLLETLDRNHTIIHVHTWVKSLSSSFVSTIHSMGFKNVITLHDYFTACPNGAFYNYQKKSICKLKPLSTNCLLSNCDKQSRLQKIWRVLRQFVQKKISKVPGGFQNFIKVSNFSEKILKPYLPKDAHIYVAENPIRISKKDRAHVIDHQVFTSVGSIDFQKGPFLFAKGAQKAEVKAKMIGAGPLMAEVAQKYPEIEITGWLKRDQVTEALEQCRVLVLPSVWYETQGLVVLEAAALGIPAIVPDTCAARDLVEDGVTGLWFRGGDLGSLSDKMQQLKSNEQVDKLGENAYEKYWSNPYSLRNHIGRLNDIYTEILSDNNNPID